MSKYTTQVRYICETVTGHTESVGYNDTENIITEAAPIIFPPFPIFDEAYRLTLETKILRHYYTDEISEETYGLWRLRLSDTLNNIMPYYNKLYNSELITFNPLYTVDYTTEHRGSNTTDNRSTENTATQRTGDNREQGAYTERENGSASRTQANNNINYDLFADTPQGALTGVESGEYLTNARKITDSATNTERSNSENDNARTENRNTDFNETSTGNRTNNSTINGTDAYTDHVFGNSGGNFSEMLLKFRETFINIDMMIINDLKPLFFGLWN